MRSLFKSRRFSSTNFYDYLLPLVGFSGLIGASEVILPFFILPISILEIAIDFESVVLLELLDGFS
jgi:hypothetical protein